MQIEEEVIQKIKDQSNIVDIISENVRLKRSGKNYVGLCPFHNDKSPSFSVSSEKQIYKCFSCGEAGNVITFIMKYKNFTFQEAAKYLADKAGIELGTNNKDNSYKSQKRDIIYKVNVESARYYFGNLQKNKFAKDYLLNRGINEKTIKKFGLGYSIDSWHALLKHLKSKGYSDKLLLESGVVSKSEKSGNIYDRFRNRIIFPVFDVKGRVIGFGGRVLDNSKPKYLNSPETLVFQKGTNLYGLNFAIKNGMIKDYIIIVEGYMDLIALHQQGITNVVASLGTALTVNQARLLKRYVDKIIISYDADLAGQTATVRGLEILKNAGFEINVLKVPDGKDPDEFVRKHGKDEFLGLIKNSLPLIDYKLARASEGLDLKNSRDLVKYGEKITDILKSLNPVEKDVYIKKISEETSIKEQALYDLLSDAINEGKKNNDFMNKKECFGRKLYIEPAYLKAERALIGLVLKDQSADYITEIIADKEFILDSHNKIYSLILQAKNEDIKEVESYVEIRCDDVESSKELTQIRQLEFLDCSDKKGFIDDCLKQILSFKIKEKIKVLRKMQAQSEKNGDFEKTIEIAGEILKLQSKLKGE